MPMVKVIRHGAVFWEAPKAPHGYVLPLLPIPAPEIDKPWNEEARSGPRSELLHALTTRRKRVAKNIWVCKNVKETGGGNRKRKPLSYWESELRGIDMDIAREKYRLNGEKQKQQKEITQ